MTYEKIYLICVLIILLLLAFSYFLILQYRRKRYKNIAAMIGGEYIDTGIFNIGKIIGTYKEKRYQIESYRDIGFRPTAYFPVSRGITYFRTKVSLDCKNTGLLLQIFPRFFVKFPNWRYIYEIRAEETVENYHLLFNLEQHYKKPIENLLSRSVINSSEILNALGAWPLTTNSLLITKEQVILDMRKIPKDKSKIERVIKTLFNISQSIEKNPIRKIEKSTV